MITLSVNGKLRKLDVPDDMPLLWTLRDVLNMTGTKFGCGQGLCGACTIHIDGRPIRSCITPVSAAAGKQVTTIEAIGATRAGKKIQAAWLELDVPQCGYCQSADHVRQRAARREAQPSDSTSTMPWQATSAVAAPIPSLLRSSWPRACRPPCLRRRAQGGMT